jgi:amino acid transporter
MAYLDIQQPVVARTSGPDTPAGHGKPGLQGRLGTLDIVLATLAYTGPLAGTAGYITFIVAYGNGLGAPAAFIPVTIAFLLFAYGYGAMTRFVPNPGAFYAYITAGLGRITGLGSAFLIMTAYLSIGVGFYGFAGLAAQQFIVGHGGPTLPWWSLSLVFWAIVATLAYFHINVSAKVLGVLLVAEILAILVFNGAIFARGGAEGISATVFSWHNFTSGELGIALVFAAALFAGFEATAIYREEVRDPHKTIPRATIIVAVFIGVLYIVTSWALITGMGSSRAIDMSAADPSGAFFTVATQFAGRTFYDITSVLLLTSTLAAHLAIQNVTTRYVYSMSIDGIFPRVLGVAHFRHRSPSRASMLVSSVYLCLTATAVIAGLSAQQIYGWFAGLASEATLAAMTLTSLAAFVYFRRNRHHDVTLWSGTIAPALAVLGLASIVYLGAKNFASLIGGSQTLASGMLIGILAAFVLGCAVAAILRRTAPRVYARIGRQDLAAAPAADDELVDS